MLRRRDSDEFQGAGYAAGFYGGFHLQFGKDFLAVAAHGVDADVEPCGYRAAFHSGVDQRKYLSLAGSEDADVRP